MFYTLCGEETYSGNTNNGLEITVLDLSWISCLFTVLVENYFGLTLK